MDIRVGFIGTGGIAYEHARALAGVGRLRLTAACDNNPERLRNFLAAFPGPRACADYRDLLASDQLDAVFILLPHHLHEPAAIDALRAGKHVLLDKPIARTLAEADRILAVAQSSPAVFMVGHNERYWPVYQYIRQIIERGDLGPIFAARADHHQNPNFPRDSWWRSAELVGGGCVMGSGIHRLDLLRWYLGEVDEVFARAVSDPRRGEAEIACVASLRFGSGAIADFFCNWAAPAPPPLLQYRGEGMSLFGRDGALYLADRTSVWIKRAQREAELIALEGLPDQATLMYEHFADCIERGEPPLTGGAEARAALEVVEAIYESLRTQQPVKLQSKSQNLKSKI